MFFFFVDQHHPGLGDADVGLREDAGGPRGPRVCSHRPRGEAGECSITYLDVASTLFC